MRRPGICETCQVTKALGPVCLIPPVSSGMPEGNLGHPAPSGRLVRRPMVGAAALRMPGGTTGSGRSMRDRMEGAVSDSLRHAVGKRLAVRFLGPIVRPFGFAAIQDRGETPSPSKVLIHNTVSGHSRKGSANGPGSIRPGVR